MNYITNEQLLLIALTIYFTGIIGGGIMLFRQPKKKAKQK